MIRGLLNPPDHEILGAPRQGFDPHRRGNVTVSAHILRVQLKSLVMFLVLAFALSLVLAFFRVYVSRGRQKRTWCGAVVAVVVVMVVVVVVVVVVTV